jgi:hypothetical protein
MLKANFHAPEHRITAAEMATGRLLPAVVHALEELKWVRSAGARG